jgi:uncharacterized OB-fold protein
MSGPGPAGPAEPTMTATSALAGPITDEDSANFWAGTRRHELRLQRCRACGQVRFPPMPRCPNCGSPDAASELAEPAGAVYSWITVQREMSGIKPDELPCTFVVVDLTAGCRMVGRFAGLWAGRIGDPVVAVPLDHEDWTEIRFAAADPSGADS